MIITALNTIKNMLEDIIKAYNKIEINSTMLYCAYLDPSVKSYPSSELKLYFTDNKSFQSKTVNSIFFSLLKETGNALYKRCFPFYKKYEGKYKLKNQNLPIICYNEESKSQIQQYSFDSDDNNFIGVNINKISQGAFACMEFTFILRNSGSELFKSNCIYLNDYYSGKKKDVSIIIATSSFINLINKEYRFAIQRIPHLLKTFGNNEDKELIKDEDLIQAFLQNAKEKENYPVYKNILDSIKSLKESGKAKDQQILRYLKKDIDISSSSSKVNQVKNKLQNDDNLTALSEKVKNKTSPVEVARAISEHCAVCDDEPLKMSLKGYLKELGFSLEEFPASSNVFSRVAEFFKEFAVKSNIQESIKQKVACLEIVASAFQKKTEAFYRREKFSVSDIVNDEIIRILNAGLIRNELSYIDDDFVEKKEAFCPIPKSKANGSNVLLFEPKKSKNLSAQKSILKKPNSNKLNGSNLKRTVQFGEETQGIEFLGSKYDGQYKEETEVDDWDEENGKLKNKFEGTIRDKHSNYYNIENKLSLSIVELMRSFFIQLLMIQYKELVNFKTNSSFKSCLEKSFSIFGLTPKSKHFQSLYNSDGSLLSTYLLRDKDKVEIKIVNEKLENWVNEIQNQKIKSLCKCEWSFWEKLLPGKKMYLLYNDLDKRKSDENALRKKIAAILPYHLTKWDKYSFFICSKCKKVFMKELPMRSVLCECRGGTLSSIELRKNIYLHLSKEPQGLLKAKQKCTNFFNSSGKKEMASLSEMREKLVFIFKKYAEYLKNMNIGKVISSFLSLLDANPSCFDDGSYVLCDFIFLVL